ncbi:DUF4199 domain-containing protein [Bacteroidota bacterium]
MEEQVKIPVFKGSLIYGLIVGLAMVVVNLVLYFLDLSLKSGVLIAVPILSVVLLVGALVLLRSEYGKGFIKYGQVVLASLLISIFSGILISGYNYAIFTVDESYFQDTKYFSLDKINEQYDKMEAKYEERYSEEQFDAIKSRMDQQKKKQIRKTKERSAGRTAFAGIINSIIGGLVIGLLAGIFIKRKPKPVELN